MDARSRTRLRAGFALLAGAYILVYVFRPARFGLLDHVDLAIHEAGHLVFSPFGDLIGIAGGTLLQLLVPLAFVLHFRHRDDRYAASILMLWVAQSLFNVATYAGDARAQMLPLVGGEGVIHDWAYLLGRFGLLENDSAIAALLRTTALFILAAGVWGAIRGAGVSRRVGEPEPVVVFGEHTGEGGGGGPAKEGVGNCPGRGKNHGRGACGRKGLP